MGWEKLLLRLLFFSRVMRLRVWGGEIPQGLKERDESKGFQTSWLQMTVKLWFLVCISIFKQGFFSTLYLVFRLPQILTFSNHIRQQNSLLRGKKISRDVPRVCCSRERDLRASAAFHKDTLICSEQLPVKANKDSTGCSPYSCQVVFSSPSASAEHFQRFSVIQTTRVGWHSV